MANAKKAESMSLLELKAEIASVFVLGVSPLIVHGFSYEAEQQLLLPSKKKNQAEKDTSLKHDPRAEYRGCFYEAPEDCDSAVVVPASVFNGAIRSAALRIPGATKTEVGQLVHVMGDYIAVYGLPLLDIRPVRNKDMNKTPDMRSRPIIPRWCSTFQMRYISPITKDAVAKLVGAAGMIMGIGDGRPEKGALDFGRFEVVDRDNKDWRTIANAYSKKAQLKAIEQPECYNVKTQKLLAWYDKEVVRRELGSKESHGDAAAKGKRPKRNGAGTAAHLQ